MNGKISNVLNLIEALIYFLNAMPMMVGFCKAAEAVSALPRPEGAMGGGLTDEVKLCLRTRLKLYGKPPSDQLC